MSIAAEPAFAASAGPRTPSPAPTDPLLSPAATTAHATFLPPVSGAAGLTYYAQPRQAPLYGGGQSTGAGFLDYCEVPAATLPTWTAEIGPAPATLPIAPFAGTAPQDAALARRIER